MPFQNVDVVVIGGGPAGCSAATAAARNRWKTVVIDSAVEEGFLGGLGNVSYFPGYTEASSGAELVQRFRKQAELVGVQLKKGRVNKVEFGGERPQVTVGDGEMYGARAVVLAIGAAARTNYLYGEKEFMGRGVSHDAATDGPVFLHRRVAVVGKNRTAAEEALRLARFASQVILIIPSSKLDVDEAMQKELLDNKKIEHYFSASLKKINGQDHVSSITAFIAGQEKDIEVSGVFPYVHDYQPQNDFLKGAVDLAPNGSVKIDGGFKTSAKGVFACGDVLCGKPQLPAIASSQGILAGISVDNYLTSL